MAFTRSIQNSADEVPVEGDCCQFQNNLKLNDVWLKSGVRYENNLQKIIDKYEKIAASEPCTEIDLGNGMVYLNGAVVEENVTIPKFGDALGNSIVDYSSDDERRDLMELQEDMNNPQDSVDYYAENEIIDLTEYHVSNQSSDYYDIDDPELYSSDNDDDSDWSDYSCIVTESRLKMEEKIKKSPNVLGNSPEIPDKETSNGADSFTRLQSNWLNRVSSYDIDGIAYASKNSDAKSRAAYSFVFSNSDDSADLGSEFENLDHENTAESINASKNKSAMKVKSGIHPESIRQSHDVNRLENASTPSLNVSDVNKSGSPVTTSKNKSIDSNQNIDVVTNLRRSTRKRKPTCSPVIDTPNKKQNVKRGTGKIKTSPRQVVSNSNEKQNVKGGTGKVRTSPTQVVGTPNKKRNVKGGTGKVRTSPVTSTPTEKQNVKGGTGKTKSRPVTSTPTEKQNVTSDIDDPIIRSLIKQKNMLSAKSIDSRTDRLNVSNDRTNVDSGGRNASMKYLNNSFMKRKMSVVADQIGEGSKSEDFSGRECPTITLVESDKEILDSPAMHPDPVNRYTVTPRAFASPFRNSLACATVLQRNDCPWFDHLCETYQASKIDQAARKSSYF